jgi:DNA-binding NarL/FixJ family response regulator
MDSISLDCLTPREREIVLSLRHLQNANKHIARRLNITEGTVKVHLVNIFAKLGIARRATLAAIANDYPRSPPRPGTSLSEAAGTIRETRADD